MKKIILVSVIVITAISLNSCKNPVEKIEGKWITDLGINVIADVKVSKDSVFSVWKTEVTNDKLGEQKYKIDSTKMDTVFVSSETKYKTKFFTVKDTLFEAHDEGAKIKFVRYKK